MVGGSRPIQKQDGVWLFFLFFIFQGSRLKRWRPGRLPSTALIFTEKLILDSVPIFFREGGAPDTDPRERDSLN